MKVKFSDATGAYNDSSFYIVFGAVTELQNRIEQNRIEWNGIEQNRIQGGWALQ